MLNLSYYYGFIIGNFSYNNNKAIKMRIKSNAYQVLELPDIEQSLGLVFTSAAIDVDVFYKECYGYGNR